MRDKIASIISFQTAGRRRAVAAAAIAGASVLALSMAQPFGPAVAQRADAPTVMTPMGRAPLSFADIVERVKPAVVSISVSSGTRPQAQRPTPPGGQNRGQRPNIPGLPEEWQEFFRNLPRDFGGGGGGGGGSAPRPLQAQGSGFVISEDGFVVTNNHVIDKANRIEVVFDSPDGDSNKFEAELVGTDPRTDIALLKIKTDRKFQYVRFAPSNRAPRVGDWVLAVGNPFGLGGTVTAGIVSALARSGISEGPYDYLQIDAAVNRGNSGGPTFNLDGEVVGVNTAIYSPSGGNVGIAFAVPSATVTKVVEQLRASGKVARGWLGVKIQNLDADMAKSFGLTDTAGALVQEITAKGPAEASGIKVEDVILSVNGDKIKDTKDLALKISEFPPNTVVDVRVMRRDREETIKVKLGLFPAPNAEVAAVERESAPPGTRQLTSLGLTFATPARRAASPKDARDSGVRVSAVEDGSDAATKGIVVGDMVTHVNGEAVGSVDEIDAAVKRASARGTVRLTVRSNTRTAVIALNLNKKG
jgi:serine protease Do